MTPGDERPDQVLHDKLERDAKGSAEDQVRTGLLQRVEVDFTYHAPTGDAQIAIYSDLRGRALDLARAMIVRCPPCRELSTALTHLESAVMHVNAGIARHGGKNEWGTP